MTGGEVAVLFTTQLVKVLIAGLVVSLLSAVVLRAAAKWAARMDVPFGLAYWTVYVAFVINSMLGFTAGLVMGYYTDCPVTLSILQVALLPPVLLIHVVIIRVRLKLSFGRASLVTLAMLAVWLAIVAVVVLIVVGVMHVTGLEW